MLPPLPNHSISCCPCIHIASHHPITGDCLLQCDSCSLWHHYDCPMMLHWSCIMKPSWSYHLFIVALFKEVTPLLSGNRFGRQCWCHCHIQHDAMPHHCFDCMLPWCCCGRFAATTGCYAAGGQTYSLHLIVKCLTHSSMKNKFNQQQHARLIITPSRWIWMRYDWEERSYFFSPRILKKTVPAQSI